MKRIARSLELSIATHSGFQGEDRIQQRRASLAELENPAERAISLGLDHFAAKNRTVAKHTLNALSLATAGLHYIGNGAQASVYRSGEEVIKVYRDTIDLEPGQQHAYAEQRQDMANVLEDHLGAMVARQLFYVGKHPLGKYTMVLGSQEYVKGTGLDLFARDSFDIKHDAVASFCERQPTAEADLRHLIEATFACSDNFEAVPDLNGSDNFRLLGAGEALRLIDAEPVLRSEHPGVHDHILRQAEVLDAFLNAA